MLLPRTDAARVRAVAHRMGIELHHAPTPETVAQLLRIAGDHALAGAATARNEKERRAYHRQMIAVKMALEGPN